MKKKILLGIFILMISNMYSQNVSGNVTSNTGPLPAVNILVKGANNGAQTDFDGNYLLDKINTDAILVFSYLGYKSQEVTVNGRSIINVKLEEDANQLEDIVILAYVHGFTFKKVKVAPLWRVRCCVFFSPMPKSTLQDHAVVSYKQYTRRVRRL